MAALDAAMQEIAIGKLLVAAQITVKKVKPMLEDALRKLKDSITKEMLQRKIYDPAELKLKNA